MGSKARRRVGIYVGLLVPFGSASCLGAELPAVQFVKSRGVLRILVGGKPMATYCYADKQITRPYFAQVHAPDGTQVTRNHPPRENDSKDHALWHPGLWQAFGDLSGHDYWRLKAKIVCDGFVEQPKGTAGRGTFAVRNRYLTTDGSKTVCTETCRYTILVRPAGYLLMSDSVFASETGDFVFGDQEEMGFGVRLATPIAVNKRQGGRILDSQGRRNEGGIWGKQADWCDYSGTVGGHKVGITIMSDPRNVRRCRWHARDYGFMASNPYAVNAFTRGPRSRIVVKRGQTHRLRHGVLLHGGFDDPPAALRKAYKDYLKLIAK